MSKKNIGFIAVLFAVLVSFDAAAAAVCTSKASGSWAAASTWTCVGTPAVTIPTATDTAVVASPNTVTLVGSVPVTSLTVNSGGTLADGGNTLTITGNLTNNGTISGGGNMNVTGAASVISGVGTYTNSRLYVSGASPSVAAGATLNFTGSSRLYTGRTQGGTTVAGSVLTINGTINSTVASGTTTFLRLYATSTVIGTTGVISASTSAATYNTATATLTNNGSVTLQKITQNAATNSWTQGANSSLTLSAVSTVGTLNAFATGNTVTYTAPATPITPSANTYYNLAGTGVTCPHGFTVTGSDPCPAGGPIAVTMSPGSCVNLAGIGTMVWATPADAVSSNNLYATVTAPGPVGTYLSNYLKCTNYGFAIPAGATINGIVVKLERMLSSVTSTSGKDNDMRLLNAASAIVGTNHATATAYTTTDVIESHGTSADMWGAGLTVSDINNVNFGAVYSGSLTKTSTSTTRQIRADHMPITVTYTLAATAPHHIQIVHDGAGQTCAGEQLTVIACADAACTSNFTTANVSGNVTWAGTPGGTIPFTLTSGGSGQTTVSLPVATAQTVTLGTSAVSPAPTAASGCTNTSGGTACSLTFTTSTQCRDAVEVGAAAGTSIFTKLAGTAFSLDVLSVGGTNYTGTVAVELVDASAGGCATYTQLNTQNVAFSNQNRKTVNFTYANAVKSAAIRMTGSAASSCSTDKFSIRPTSLAVTSSVNADATGASVSALPKLAAGANFTLTATAIAGYNGTPTVDAAQLVAHTGSVANGSLGGSFAAANPVTGVATASTFTYSEVGYFRFNVDGVRDTTFANEDALKAPPECTLDYSNTLVGGKYGCYFGNSAATDYFGRFVPDHFTVTASLVANRADLCDVNGLLVADGVTPCVSPTFTYMGERMDAQFTLTAEASGNTPTQNYTGSFAKLNPIASGATLAFGAVDAATPTYLTARLDTSLITTSGSGSFNLGVADIVAPLGIARCTAATCPANTNPNREDGPFAALNIGIAPVDSDGVSVGTYDLDTDATAGNDHALIGSTEVRYGRLKLSNANGSELLPLTIPVTAQYWDGTNYVTSMTDSLTTFSTSNVVINNLQLKPASSTLTIAKVTPNPVVAVPFSNGAGSFRLAAPGVNATGSVNLTTNAPSYLPSNTARATFGVYKGNNNFIYLRENY